MEEGMKENKMGTAPVNRLVISMALPLMLSLLINSLYNFVDSVFVAHISEDALTGLSLAAPVQMVVSALGLGNAVGLNAVISRALGEKKEEKVRDAASAALFIAFCSWIFNCVLCIAFIRIYFQVQSGGNEVIAAYGKQYLSICMLASITNLILDPILIFGWFGLPKLETVGAALATVTGQAVGCIAGMLINRCRQRCRECRLGKKACISL